MARISASWFLERLFHHVSSVAIKFVERSADSIVAQARVYRLATTLLDHRRFPAFEIVKPYHARWKVESAYLEIKSTLLGR